MGPVAVPASDCAVQHEGEKHQEGSDAHSQNQPGPCASGEKSNQFPLSFFALVISFQHTHAHMLENTL